MTCSSERVIGESARGRPRPLVIGACSPVGKRLLPTRYLDSRARRRMDFMFASAGFVPTPAQGKEDRSVLRISSATEAGSLVKLKAEGTIVGDWVPLLEAECLCHLAARKRVELDLADVSFVDRDGLAMLQSLVTRGVEVVRASTLVYALLWRPPGHQESG